MKALTYWISITLLTFTCFTQLIAQTPDPGPLGFFAVAKEKYDLGDEVFQPSYFSENVEVKGSVHYPTDLSSGSFPVLLFLHGRHVTCYDPSSKNSSRVWPCENNDLEIPSYDGYDYLANYMASHGYIVISIGANGLSAFDQDYNDDGMLARAELIQHHLELWDNWNTTGGQPFDTKFVGKLDMNNIGTMGHSRGGEGVVRHVVLNKAQGNPYGIRAVLSLAPTNFNRPLINNVPHGIVLPYCDGDLSDLQGIHYYDDERYLNAQDSTAKHNFLFIGANHNYFNTVWTPGLFEAGTSDDWEFASNNDDPLFDPFCGTNANGNQRFSEEQQRNATIAYVGAFFRQYIGGETQFSPLLEVDDIIPPVSTGLSTTDIFVSYHGPANKRVDINRTDKEAVLTTNSIAGDASQNALEEYAICGHTQNVQRCLSISQNQEPHTKSSSTSSRLGLSQIHLQWNAASDWYENELPSIYQDVSQFSAIQFRAAINIEDAPQGQSLDFSIQFRDGNGNVHNEVISDHSNALFFPEGTLNNVLPRVIHNTIKIPLSEFSTVDLTDIQAIRFLFNASSSGAILVSDISLLSNSDVLLPPQADFIANKTITCDGLISFEDKSKNNPTQWFWDFGDGDTSTTQNPTHNYKQNGTYSVSLKVVNSLGEDSLLMPLLIEINRPTEPIVSTNDTICTETEVTLEATGSVGGKLVWYDAPLNGNVIGEGSSLNTTVNTTTHFMVQEEIIGDTVKGGKLDNSGGGEYHSGERWNYFDVHTECTLLSVKVYVEFFTLQPVIELVDSNGNVLQSYTSESLGGGDHRIPVNFNLLPGKNYYLHVQSSSDFYRNNGGLQYPYQIGNLITITQSNVTSADPTGYYYYFYDWEVKEPSCVSSPAHVSVIVDTLKPIVTIIGDQLTVTNVNPTGASFEWFKDDILIPDAMNSSYTVTQNGEYSVRVVDAQLCSGTSEKVVASITLLHHQLQAQHYKIYPNPTEDRVYLEKSDYTEVLTYSMTNILGETLIPSTLMKNQKQVIPMNNYPSGIYFLKVQDSRTTIIEKLIKE